jgi:hypothetical protein
LLVVICTIWPLPLLLHLGDGELGRVEEPGEIDTQDGVIVGLSVLGERLCDEGTGVVDERVDSSKPGHALGDCTLGGLPVGDVTGDDQDICVIRRLDRARRRDHSVVAGAIGLYQRCTDALRGTGDDCNLPFDAH